MGEYPQQKHPMMHLDVEALQASSANDIEVQ